MNGIAIIPPPPSELSGHEHNGHDVYRSSAFNSVNGNMGNTYLNSIPNTPSSQDESAPKSSSKSSSPPLPLRMAIPAPVKPKEELEMEQDLDDDDDDEEEGGKFISMNDAIKGDSKADEKIKGGRRKINIEFIENKSRRHVTFSKRKAGLIKKAYELSTLTGTQVLLLVASETGNVYTFATPKLQPLITNPEGKTLIQACLNPPETDAQPPGPTPPRVVQYPPGSSGGMQQHPSAHPQQMPQQHSQHSQHSQQQHQQHPSAHPQQHAGLGPNLGNMGMMHHHPQLAQISQLQQQMAQMPQLPQQLNSQRAMQELYDSSKKSMESRMMKGPHGEHPSYAYPGPPSSHGPSLHSQYSSQRYNPYPTSSYSSQNLPPSAQPSAASVEQQKMLNNVQLPPDYAYPQYQQNQKLDER